MLELAKTAARRVGLYRDLAPAREAPSSQDIDALLPLLTDPARDAVDVGAGLGASTSAMAWLVPHVHAFEPHPRLRRLLRAKLPSNTSVHGVALSDMTGTADLLVPYGEGRACDAQARLAWPSGSTSGICVDRRRLDDLIGGDIGFVRIDVGGHELNVLQGASEAVKRTRPIVMIQTDLKPSDSALDDTLGFFQVRSYVGFIIDRDRPVLLGSAKQRSRAVVRLDLPDAERPATFVFVPSESQPFYVADGIEWVLNRPARQLARQRSRQR